jgi:starvation-inducible DNA-binding protein
MHQTKNDLPLEKRELVAKLLNDRLADLIDLQLQAKQAHWNVKGPNFIALHELFDDIAEELEEFVDTVAERLTALGGIAEGTVQAVGKRTGLKPYPVDLSAGRDHVDALSTAVAACGKSIRASIDRATEAGDADTADVFTEVSRGLDQRLWFLEAHLQADK